MSDIILKEENRKKLDDIVSKMIANKESDADIQLLVEDFKSKYGEKKNETLQPVAPTGSKPSKTGFEPFQTQVDTSTPSVILSDEQKLRQEQERIGKRFETTLLDVPTEFGKVANFMDAAKKVKDTLPQAPEFRRYGEIPKMQPTEMTEGQKLGESLTKGTADVRELITDKLTGKKTGLQKQIEAAQEAFRQSQGGELVGEIQGAQQLKNMYPESVETERERKGNYAKFLYNQFLSGTGSAASGLIDFALAIDKSSLSASPISKSGFILDYYRKNNAKGVRNFLKDNIGFEVDKGLEAKYNEGMLTGAIGGLASSAPAMITAVPTMGGSLFAQMYDGALQSIEAQPDSDKWDNDTKTIYAGSLGLIQAGLEKYGLDKILKGGSGQLTDAVFRKILKSAEGRNITGHVLENLIDENVKGVARIFAKGGVRAVDAFVTEFFTGSGQETAAIGSEIIFDKATGKPIFNTANKTDWIGFVERIAKAGTQEGIGGFVLGGGVGMLSGLSKKKVKESQAVINEIDRQLDNPNTQPEVVEVLLQRKADTQANIDDVVDLEADVQSKMSPDELTKSQELSKQIDKIDLALQDPNTGESVKADLEFQKEAIEKEIDEILRKVTAAPQPKIETREDIIKEIRAAESEMERTGDFADYKIKIDDLNARLENLVPVPEDAEIGKPEEVVSEERGEKMADVFHGGSVKDIQIASIDNPLYVSESESQSAAYAKGNQGKVAKFKVDKSKIANEDEVRDVINELGLKPKDESWSVDELNIYELIDPTFDTAMSSESINKLFKELEKRGYGGAEFLGMNIETLKNDINDIVIFNPKLATNVEQTKPKQDAIQEQATGQVPVQPEAPVSEEVEQGKPEAKPKVVAKEGKEVGSGIVADVDNIKNKQLEIINKTNPAPNNYNTWIRKVEDIKTADEAFKVAKEEGAMYPDFTEEQMQEALDSGEVTVYSSMPIKDGVFVSPSKMNAQEYAGGKGGKLYSKKVKLDDVAWIDEGEGQYASVSVKEQTPAQQVEQLRADEQVSEAVDYKGKKISDVKIGDVYYDHYAGAIRKFERLPNRKKENGEEVYSSKVVDENIFSEGSPNDVIEFNESDYLKSRPAETFLESAEDLFYKNPFLGYSEVFGNDGKQVGWVALNKVDNNTVDVDNVVSMTGGKREGGGSQIMKMVTKNADRAGVTLTLVPEPLPRRAKEGFDTPEKLQAFYEKFGFVKDKKKPTMTRKPQPVIPQTVNEQIAELRIKEQVELKKSITNAEQYLTDGKVDRDKITDAKDLKKFDEIYDKYDKLITPLLPEKETAAPKQEALAKAKAAPKLTSKVDTKLKIKALSDLDNKIKSEKGRAKKSKLEADKLRLIEKNPSIGYVYDNLKNILDQLVEKGLISSDGKKVVYEGKSYATNDFTSVLHDGLLDQMVKDGIVDDSRFKKMAEQVERTEFDSEEDAELYAISRETDPNVIAAKYFELPTAEDTNFKDYQIMQYIGKIKEKDWAEYNDLNNLTPELRRRYIDSTNKKASGLDVQAQELQEQLGIAIDPSDFIDVILEYKDLDGFKIKSRSNVEQALLERYNQLTGKNKITDATAKKAFETVNKGRESERKAFVSKEKLEEIGVTEEDIARQKEFEEAGFGELETPLEKYEYQKKQVSRKGKTKLEIAKEKAEKSKQMLRDLGALDSIVTPIDVNDTYEATGKAKEYLAKVTPVLNELFPNLTIKVYNTRSEYEKATGRPAMSAGSFHRDSSTIALNLELIEKYGAYKTFLHEAIHPIVDAVFLSNPKLREAAIKDIRSIRGVPGMNRVFEHMSSYKDRTKEIWETEGITEFVTLIANGDIDLANFESNLFTRVKEVFNRIMEYMGSDFRLETAGDIFLLSARIKEAFDAQSAEPIKKTLSTVKGVAIDLSKENELLQSAKISLDNLINDKKSDANEIAKALKLYHQDLVDVAKSYIKEISDLNLSNVKPNINEFAENIGESVTDRIKDAWNEAIGKSKKRLSDFIPEAEKIQEKKEKERLAGKSKRMTTQRLLASSEYSDKFKEAIGENAIYYTELPNEITEKEAQAIIDIKGDVDAEMAIMDMNNNMKLAIRLKIAQKLIDNYDSEGNFAKSVEIYENIAEKITDAAQGLQSLSTWPKLSPAAAVYMARKNVKKQFDAKAANAKQKTDKIDNEFKKINKESIQEALDKLKKKVENSTFPSKGGTITELPLGYGRNNKVFTREKYELAKKKIRGFTFSFAGGVPIEQFIDIAGFHIEATGKDFNKFARRMKADLGSKIKPYLKNIYAKTREQLIDAGYDKDLFLSDEDVNSQILEQEGKVFEEKLKKAIEKKDEKAAKAAIAKLQEISKEDGLWGQYKQAAANKLKNVVITNIKKDIAESTSLDQFTNGLVKNMRAKMAELLPEAASKKNIQRPDIEIIGDAFKNFEKYKEVWEQTQLEFQEKYQDFPEVLESIDAYFGEILDKPFNDKMLSRAISKGLKEMGTTISEIVTKHYTVVDNTRQSLADKLVNDAGLSGAEAEVLSRAIQKEFDNIATKKKSQILERMFSKRDRKKTEIRTLEQDLIRMTNLGAFRNDSIVQMYGDKMGWPKLTDENIKELERLATIVQKTEDPIKKRKAVEDLLAYQANIKGTSIMEFVTAVWYANILSGYNTQAVNFGANAFNTAILFGNLVAQNPKNARFIGKGLIEGTKRGFLEGREVLRTGYSPIKAKAEIPTLLERKDFSKSVENLPTPVIKLVNYAAKLKYVRRLMVAADVVFFEGIKEMRAYQQAAKQASLENKENPSLTQFDRAIELVGKSDIQLQKIQEKVELEFERELEDINNSSLSKKEKEAAIKQAEIDKKRRTFDLIEQNRGFDMIIDSAEFAAEGTYNYPPKGALGAVAAGINQIIKSLPAVRYAIPFTNIIANVANETLNYTPAAFFMLKKGGIVPYRLAPLTEQQRTDLLYKGIIGTTLMSTVFLLTQLKGDDDEPILEITANGTGDYAKNGALRETGWEPYSLRFKLPNGKYTGWISYQFSPLVAGLGYVGNINDLMKYTDSDEETIISAMTTGAGMTTASFFQGTFLTGLNDFASAVLDPRSVSRGEQVMEKILNAGVSAARAVLIPNLFSQVSQSVQKATNEYKKETRETIMGKFLQDVPYARDIYFDKINILGDPISPDTDKFYSSNKPNKVIELLIKNKKVFGPINRKAEKIYDITLDKERALTDEEFFEYSKEKGQFIKNALLQDYDKFSKMTSSEFGKELTAIKREATASAREKIGNIEIEIRKKKYVLSPQQILEKRKLENDYVNTDGKIERMQLIMEYKSQGKSDIEASVLADRNIKASKKSYAQSMIESKYTDLKGNITLMPKKEADKD